MSLSSWRSSRLPGGRSRATTAWSGCATRSLERMAADRRAVEAPPRPDSESRQCGPRVDGLRARHAHRRHGRARPGADGDRSCRRRAEGRQVLSRRRSAGCSAVAENYPTLKSNDNVQDAAGGTVGDGEQGRLRAAVLQRHRRPTSTPRSRCFPTNVFAGAFGFKPSELFEITDATERAVPVVDLASRQ